MKKLTYISMIVVLACGNLYSTKPIEEQNKQLISKCLYADYDAAKNLLDAGANPNAYYTITKQTEPPKTILYSTFRNAISNTKCDPRIVQLLLDYGGDPNQSQSSTSHLLNAFLANKKPAIIHILIDNGARLANQQEYNSVFKTFADYRLRSPGHKKLFKKFVLDLHPTPQTPIQTGVQTLQNICLKQITSNTTHLSKASSLLGTEHPICAQIIAHFSTYKTVRECAQINQKETNDLFTVIKAQHKLRFENKEFTFTENGIQTTLNPHTLIEDIFKL